MRDWIHVLDHYRGLDMILQKGIPGEVYNIGANEEVANIDLVKRILDCLGKSYELITYVDDRLGHDRRYAIDSGKIQNLGWKPQYTLEDTLREVVEWYRDMFIER